MADQDHDLLTKVGRSYVRHQYEDGLDELTSGVDLAVMGVALYVLALSLRQQIDYGWFGAAIFFSLAVAVARDRVKERIRQRITYPRIGYASAERGEPLRRNRKLVMWLILLPMAVAPVVFTVLLFTGRVPELRTAAEWARWAPAVFGVLAAAGSLWDAERFGIQRFRLSGVMIGLAGILASLAAADVVSAFGLFCLGWGVINLTAGGITLWRFSSADDSGTP